jgi:hypothetical protein
MEQGSSKAVLGILLVGGGVFLIIALFNGTLKFPLGNVNMFGSHNGILGTGIGANAPANVPGAAPIQTTKPDPNTLQCPKGFTAYRASAGNIICVKTS